jgi:hypothetical protein
MFVQESPERSRQNGRLSCRDERERDLDPESVTLRDCLIVSSRPRVHALRVQTRRARARVDKRDNAQ